MQINVTKTQDLLTPSLRRAIAQLSDPTPALKAAATVLVSLATRAFNDPSLRPTAWRPLSAATLAARKREGRGNAPLKRTGDLSQSPRIVSVNRREAVIGSKAPYAGYQQLGSKDGRRPPPRPFFPFSSTGVPTTRARQLTAVAIRRTLQLRK